MSNWRKRAEWLVRGFDSRSKATVTALQDLVQFLNGNTADSQGPLVHWCLLPANNGGQVCCESEGDSWNRLISCLTAFLAKGFAVPLLYRMKHYCQASSYMRVATNLHGILPRILQEMESISMSSASSNSKLSEVVDVLLAESKVGQQPSQGLSNEDFQALLGEMLTENADYAAQNGVRRKMVLAEVSKETFSQSSIIIDMLVQPLERATNFFLKRTKLLYDMQYLSRANPCYEEQGRESKEKFLQVIQGDLGKELLRSYIGVLSNSLKEATAMGLQGTQEQLNLIFQMICVSLTDLQRRLVQEFMQPPYTLLALADADFPSFVSGWQQLQQRHKKCKQCVDVEFTAALLNAYRTRMSSELTPEQAPEVEEVQALLRAICTWCPLTSDAVEILHGQMQWCLSRRGSTYVKGGRSAVETSLLSMAVKQHKWISDMVASTTMPSKSVSSRIQRMSGTTSSNQHSRKAPDNVEAADRVLVV